MELGPLNHPIVTKDQYPNCRYCDIRTTEEVKQLYSGNSYLEATGIYVDTDTIVEIDDVIHGSYSHTYRNQEKFDIVLASHVLEHMEDLIFGLRDIASILKMGGIFCISYPDKRYAFDHFRESASFREAYMVYKEGKELTAGVVLDFFFSSIQENTPDIFWAGNDINRLLPLKSFSIAKEKYDQIKNGIRMPDVHYWPFTDWSFLKFLFDCTRARLLPLKCVGFESCVENDQQFLIALEYNPTMLVTPEDGLRALQIFMKKTHPNYYCSKDINTTKRIIAIEHDLIESQEKLHIYMQKNEELEMVLKEKNLLNRLLEEKNLRLLDKDNIIQEKTSSLLVKDRLLQEKNNMIQNYLTDLILKENRIENLKSDLLEKIKNIQVVQNTLIQKDILIKQKEKLIREKESSILELKKRIEEIKNQKDFEINNKEQTNQKLRLKIKELTTIEESTIWRITKPIRFILDFFKALVIKEKK